jgi:hypothetical protein
VCIWAIASYFNPVGYANKLLNFKAFHAKIGLPLLVVELVFPGHESELAPYLSEFTSSEVMHIIVKQGDVMWQKERLFNVGLSRLPQHVKYVVGTDSDLIFDDSTWPFQVIEALRVHPLVQCFGRIRYLEPDALSSCVVSLDKWSSETPSCMFTYLQSGILPRIATGGVWAGHVDFLRKHGFYDALIVGSNDAILAHAAIGTTFNADRWKFDHRLMAPWIAHYEAWSSAFYDDLKRLGKTGCLGNTVYHLWHGEKADRQYVGRHRALADHAFDPSCDIRINEEGSWSWNSDKPEMHEAVRSYFSERREEARPE